jgi:hypothetical protein
VAAGLFEELGGVAPGAERHRPVLGPQRLDDFEGVTPDGAGRSENGDPLRQAGQLYRGGDEMPEAHGPPFGPFAKKGALDRSAKGKRCVVSRYAVEWLALRGRTRVRLADPTPAAGA